MKLLKNATLALVAAGTLAGAAAPAVARPDYRPYGAAGWDGPSWNHGDDRRWDNEDGDRGYGRGYQGNGYRRDYYRDSAWHSDSWRGRDGRTYCRRSDGTTGLLIGGAAGALIGRGIAGDYGDRTLGAILGAAGGALLGREADRGGARCR